MISDNASTYTLAAEELSQSEDLVTALGTHGVVWKFIPKKSPWFGASGNNRLQRTELHLQWMTFSPYPCMGE